MLLKSFQNSFKNSNSKNFDRILLIDRNNNNLAGKIKNSSEVIKIDRSILSFFFFLKKLNSILKFHHSLPD